MLSLCDIEHEIVSFRTAHPITGGSYKSKSESVKQTYFNIPSVTKDQGMEQTFQKDARGTNVKIRSAGDIQMSMKCIGRFYH